MEFLYFLGRFHVLVLHLPIGIIVAIVCLEWLARKEKYQHLRGALPFLWGACAVSALVTVLLGYMHFAEGGFEGSSGNQHRLFGTLFAVLTTAVALLRVSPFAGNYAPLFLPASVVLLLIVSITGHYGGNLTHGSTYLIEYAPQPLRALAGLPPRRPPVTNLAAADPFEDVVAPMFQQRCGSCHNSDKRQGELDLTSYQAAMRGGETGRVIAAGRPEVSELLRRITLPHDDEEFMPAEGKTPLTDRQVRIIEWWIAAGAVTGTPIGQLDVPPEIEALLRAELGLES
ncbi:MAG TPA: c-type cytochrome domain-containing protein [Gammaproteobacteria bacterium]